MNKIYLTISYKCPKCEMNIANINISYHDINLSYDKRYLYTNKTVKTKCPFCSAENILEIY